MWISDYVTCLKFTAFAVKLCSSTLLVSGLWGVKTHKFCDYGVSYQNICDIFEWISFMLRNFTFSDDILNLSFESWNTFSNFCLPNAKCSTFTLFSGLELKWNWILTKPWICLRTVFLSVLWWNKISWWEQKIETTSFIYF